MGVLWTVEQEDELRGLQKQNLSAAQIARVMAAGLSRNAVIGKLHRMGLKPTSQAHRAPGVRKPRAQRRSPLNTARAARNAQHAERAQQAAERRAMFAAEQAVELPPEDLSKAVTLLELSAHTCRWPIGDPGSGDFFFCGVEPSGEKPYCLRHCLMAYTRPTRPETRAAA